ncbi:GNAT family N-acetyltransferase [Citricoccus sp. NPDC055426]|uniref:GNAT family N-acetyltransferase n=1 Tax=Citricoccus sp. NPDC055426 TaxID=3155536 RepID=UPI003444F55E
MSRAGNRGPDAGRPGLRRGGTRYFVRDAAAADLEAVLAMKAAAWREAYGHLRDESFFERAEATLGSQVEHWRSQLAAGRTLWLAEDARGRCVGMAAAGPVIHGSPSPADDHDSPELQLYSIYVLAQAQGSGVADALLDRAIGSGDCLLWVLTGNGRARAFYARHGFTAVGDPVPMEGPWSGLDEQLMVRRGA